MCSSDLSAFNVMAAAFPQIFWVFPPFFQIHRTRPPLLSFLEGFSSCWDTNLRYASHVKEDFPPQTFLHVLLTYKALCWAFTIYWQSPWTFYCPRTGPWPNILFRALTPTIAPQNSGFSIPSEERKRVLTFLKDKFKRLFDLHM